MKKLLFLLILPVTLFIFSGCDAGSGSGDDFEVWEREDPDKWAGSITGKWTVMVWLDGDNNLEAASLLDFNEMEYGLYLAEQGNSNINNELAVLVQIDRVPGYVNYGLDGGPDWTNTRRYRITSDSNTGDDMIRSYHLANMEETNMGSAANLKDFISYCKTNYPADHYALILWNHGGGVRGTISAETFTSKTITKSAVQIEPVTTAKAVCWDDTNGEDCLYIGEITDVLTDSENVDLIGFDACLMGMAEIAYEYRPGNGGFSADYMAASSATEQGDGWEYQNIFRRFSGSSYTDADNDPCYDASSVTGSDFAEIVVEEYKDAFSSASYEGETMAAYDLSKIVGVKTALDSLASGLDSAGGKTISETARDNTMVYFDTAAADAWINWLGNPHFDLYDYGGKVGSGDLQEAVADCVIASWGNSYAGHFLNDDITLNNEGLGFFYPDGNQTYNGYSHYVYQWWYTNEDTNSWWPGGHYYGKLDFCNSNENGAVEGWRELLEYWFDNGTYYTPSSH